MLDLAPAFAARLLVAFAALSASASSIALAQAPASSTIDAQNLLTRSDAVRNPPGSFSARVTLTEYRDGAQSDSAALMIYSRPSENSGQYYNLVRYEAPARDNGKLLLHKGVDLWFFDPASAASVRISPQARLLGEASNGDVMTTNLGKDYRATLLRTENTEDAAHHVHECAVLHLTAEREDVPYNGADYWIDRTTAVPVKINFLTSEGRVLKTAYFRRFDNVLGVQRPTETVILDGLNPHWITVMRTGAFTPREISVAWFQRDYLPRFEEE
ncbi:outer membrane lipoprotein-sorting protein [Nguyenibacter vanlangensis]|uniref:Outer membrane lipoprotein-sorting protein n=1 Tax=Nguyenibacter vanlangensis TaxID=1216886 RepID=A0ABZ3D2I5_9PROT